MTWEEYKTGTHIVKKNTNQTLLQFVMASICYIDREYHV